MASFWRYCGCWLVLCGLVGCHHTREIPSGLPCEIPCAVPCYPLPPVDVCETACPEVIPAAALAGPPLVADAAEVQGKTPYLLSLEEARELALRNSKTIRVVGHLPQEAATLVAATSAIFDPIVGLNGIGGRFDRQVPNQITTLGAPVFEQRSSLFGPQGLNQMYVTQPFDTGGQATIGFGTNYLFQDPVGNFALVNPYWRSAVNLNITQPLFQGRGPQVTRAPIAIARANHNQSIHSFQAAVQDVLLNVELAYWDLVLAHRNLQTSEQVLKQAELTFNMEQERLRIGEGSVPDAAQAEEQFQFGRIRRTDALRQVALASYNLRRLIGLPADDYRQLIPSRDPIPSRLDVDWEAALDSAQTRPELLAQQAQVRAARVDLARAKNLLQHDVGLVFNYAMTGLEENFDHSVSTIADGEYQDWTAGIIFEQPWGQRAERAEVRRAELALSRSAATYRQIEHEVVHELAAAYQDLVSSWRVLELHRRRREVAQLQIDARKELYQQRRTTLDLQLQAEAGLAVALLAESAALVDYEKALVRWQYASGVTLCDHLVIRESEIAEPVEAEPLDPPLPMPQP